MRVDKTEIKDVLEVYDFIIEELARIGSDIPWDLPPNVLKCRQIYEARLKARLEVLIASEEGKEYRLKRFGALF